MNNGNWMASWSTKDLISCLPNRILKAEMAWGTLEEKELLARVEELRAELKSRGVNHVA